MKKTRQYINLFEGKRFSSKQAELIRTYRSERKKRRNGDDYAHIFSVVWGRRCGKSDGCSALFAEMLADLIDELADKIARGKLRPWRGIGRKRSLQRKSKPHAKCLISAPRSSDLNEISSFLLDIFRGHAECYLHPDESMTVDLNGSRLWFYKDGACVTVDLIPAVSKSSMVGRGWSLVFLSEAGFIDNIHWDRLSPSFWDESPWVIVEGTPAQDASHFLSQLAVAGLPDDNEEADRTIAARNPAVITSRANTIDHAFLRTARQRAAEEEKYRGKRWADLWIRASWKAPSDLVYDAWHEDRSVVELGQFPLRVTIAGVRYDLPSPSVREIYVDWHGGASPGAAIVCYIWKNRNPLDSSDTRPLVLVVDEHQDDEERLQYDAKGWWRVLQGFRDKWSTSKIWGDPSGETLMKSAKRAGLKILPAENADKSARIQITNSLANCPEDGMPALLISSECKKLVSVMNTYHWKRDKKTDLPTDKPTQYNDHLSDCLCYCAGHHAKGSFGGIGLGW